MAHFFTLNELTYSNEGIKAGLVNKPDAISAFNLGYLTATILDPLRKEMGFAILVNSGYRSPDVNDLVNGAKRSFHLYGRAADIRPVNLTKDNLEKMYDYINRFLPYKELKRYPNFIHVAI